MCGRERVLECVARHAAGADVAVVEGVMGCFDGFEPTSDEGSTAQIAKWLGAPVVLVLDAWAQARSAAAVVCGFERFDPALGVAGVIVNRVAGEGHGRLVLAAIGSACRAEPLGALVRDERLALPERHLGLVTAVEGTLDARKLQALGDAVEASVNLDRLLSLAGELGPLAGSGRGRSERARPSERRGAAPSRPVRVGVAHDAAFQFYYLENLERLREAGAELVYWSPLAEPELPEVDGLYFGGGYPELHARGLAEHAAMRKAVRRFAEAGRPIYAECGGLMYLAEALEDAGGAVHPMVGVLPATVRMRPRRLALGYTEVTLTRDTPLGPAGASARGHEFHCSTLDPVPDAIERAYSVRARGGAGRAEGYLVGRTLMSYVHLHFASNPALAGGFVAACAGGRA
jgi:cobyrinic acid a,c-diamide synthase